MAVRPKSPSPPDGIPSASGAIKATAWLVAIASIAFAGVNIAFVVTGRFGNGPFSEYSSGLSIMNWFVAGLKVAGSVIAWLSITRRPMGFPVRVVNAMIWGAAALLGIYSLGNMAQALGMAAGLTGSIEQIDPAGIAYVILFLLAAAGFTALAVSHTKRSGQGVAPAIVGSIGAVVLLGVILVALPMVLSVKGVLPSP